MVIPSRKERRMVARKYAKVMKFMAKHMQLAGLTAAPPLTAEEISEGKKKLDLAMSAMLRNEMFFLEIVTNLRIRATTECWMAAIMVNPMPTLLWNPRSISKLNIKQIIYVLKHEIHHVILEHFLRTEECYTPMRANKAQDLECNWMIGEPPIEGLLYPGKGGPEYNKLKTGEIAEYYYNRLPADPPNAGSGAGAEHERGSDPNGPHFEVSHLQDFTEDDVGTVHIHDIIKDAAEKARSFGQGFSGDLDKILDQYLKKDTLNWKRLLRNLIGNGMKFNHRSTWKRPNRRYGSAQKGKVPLKTMDIVVAIDTSGSISDEEVRQFLNEIEGIKRSYPCNIWVVQCDTRILEEKKYAKFEKITFKMKGGGGTDFRPVFKWMEDKKLEQAQLVYFTDLYGEFPTAESTKVKKTIWVLPPSSRGDYDCKPPFGYVIRIPDHDAQKMRRKR